MKKSYLAGIALISIIPFASKAQTWSGATPGNIYYNSGNVGIGTTNPITKLDVAGSQQLNGDLSFASDQTAYFIKGPGNGGAIRIRSNISAAVDRNIQFGNIDNNGTWHSYVIVDQTGNVGIGTTSPSAKLHVENGSALINTDALAGLGGQVTISNNYGNQNGSVRLNLNNGGAVSWIKGIVTGANTNTGSAMVFGVPSNTADGIEQMRLTSDGNLAIGTTDPHGYKLAVNGDVISTSMTVKFYANWPDYVFKPTYKLPSLTEVKTYIDKNQHLPEIPSEQEIVKNGLNLGEMNKLLMKKVEELTLYLIEEHEKNQKEIDQLKWQLNALAHK